MIRTILILKCIIYWKVTSGAGMIDLRKACPPAMESPEMPPQMTSRQRLLAVLAGQPTDRVPVLAGHFNEWQDDWKSREPSYRELVDFCRRHCDGIISWGPRALNASGPMTSSNRSRVERRETALADGGHETLEILHTPGGVLRRRLVRKPEAETVWQVEHYLKSPDDAEIFLTLIQVF